MVLKNCFGNFFRSYDRLVLLGVYVDYIQSAVLVAFSDVLFYDK